MSKIHFSLRMLWLVCVGAALVVSCVKGEYPELNYSPDGVENKNQETIGNIVITPTLDYTSLFFITTRGSGPFDKNLYLVDFPTHYLNSKYYLLAYRHPTAMGEMSVPADFSLLMNSNTNIDRKVCLLSTEKVSPALGDHRGKVAEPVDMTGALKLLDDETASKEVFCHWNNVYSTTPYDFFAYHIDDAIVTNVETTKDQTAIDLTIDGTQDLMVGVAPEVTEDLIKSYYPAIKQQETIDKILSYGQGGYTTYGAQCSLQPRIEMKHCLARIVVSCRLLDNSTNIKPKELRIKAQNQGKLIVAAAEKKNLGFTPKGDYSTLTFPNSTVSLEYNKDVPLGSGVMVPSADSYEITMVYDETFILDANTTKTVTNEVSFLATPTEKPFQPGNLYIVNVLVWGSTKIDVSVSTQTTWQDGGNIQIGMQD